MALRFFDGFGTDNDAEIYETNSTITLLTTPATPANHSPDFRQFGDSGARFAQTHFGQISGDTLIVGMLLYVLNPGPDDVLMYMRDTAEPSTNNWSVEHDSVGSRITLVAGGVRLDTPNGSFPEDEWHYLEFKYKFHNSTGTMEILIDGVSEASATGLDTIPAGADGTIDWFQLGGTTTNDVNLFYMTDFYICDGSGTIRNDFLGAVESQPLLPDADGFHTDFTPLSSTNISNVDEPGNHDGDTSYNAGTTAGDQDSYNMTTLTGLAGRQILGLQVEVIAEKNDTGTKHARPFIRPASADTFGPSQPLANGVYGMLKNGAAMHIWEQNPDDSLDWEQTDIDGLEIGIEARDVA